MTLRVALNHQTHYRFDRAVLVHPHIVRLRPAAHARTPIQAYTFRVAPADHFINWQQDPFGNYLARLVFPEKTRELRFEVELVAEMTVINPFDFFLEDRAQHYPFEYETALRRELAPYLEIRERGPRLMEWLTEVPRTRRPTVDFLVELNRRVQRDIAYVVRMEAGVQSCEETLALGSGSCRDSGWLLVQILRHLGLAARFVSGYLIQLAPDIKPLDGPAGPEQDFTDLHAWAEVYVAGAGWVGLDPTSGLLAGEGHIPLACTPEPASAAPVTGATERCEVDFHFAMTLERVHEDPRVTRPYTEAQWQRIDALGQAVDARLGSGDVRLTLGGEPTFVSVDDMDAPEWTTAALGPAKRRLGGQLLRRLQARFAPGALLRHGQGKWYPGEPLPRWALECCWRSDGVALWREPGLLAEEDAPRGHGPEEARRFGEALVRRLGLRPGHLLAAYEDVHYQLWQERRLPVDVDPAVAKLDDPEERRRLARLLEQGLGTVAGYALPLRWREGREEGRWTSGTWRLRRERLFLVPGDSPMGFRLPLAELAGAARDQEHPHPQSLFETRPVLGDAHGEVMRRYSSLIPDIDRHPEIQEQPAEDADTIIHTALCVEPRGGHLWVFLPPVSHLEHFVDLVACVEHTAAELGMPVFIEGYPAPADWRLKRFAVTPDPGVIEVNIHPAGSWRELVQTTEVLYEEARTSRLGTEKFMGDGRHTGTGGGNHVTLGGETPADSPFLRRPDVLGSLITYWQHHPSLSYLFSGLFVGPTSQAPRVDEARHESLYELEIALQQMPAGEVPAPWLVDRLLRHLLVDITGNTHRAEFCIDKLYSPDTATGRLGLVELRAFEMPPHSRMSLVQMLLIRALVARFWERPYLRPLVRWGTALHDRMMLPHHLWRDLADVVDDLGRAGFVFDLAWFAPFLEFRFPPIGSIAHDGVELELRQAVEPWHVLGEEAAGGGTARYVDSSLERLQVKAGGTMGARYVVACNGRRVPLHPTGTGGEFVGGVRYRAWQPPSALHPNIPVHVPLVLDIVDTWNGRSVGGCTYHVQHPGGRNPDTFPVNANEAEARRAARFWPYGHTPGPMEPPPEEPGGEYPHTLDLRRRAGP